jgi:hypothetical protein
MNPLERVKLAEAKVKAEQSIAAEIEAQKHNILTEFAKPVLEFLNYVQNSDIRFKGGFDSELQLVSFVSEGINTKEFKKLFKNSSCPKYHTTLGYIHFVIDDDFKCSIPFGTSPIPNSKENKVFYDVDTFLNTLSEEIINRKIKA